MSGLGVIHKKNRGQSVLEYTILIVAIASAFMAMNLYVRRSVNARLHNMELELNPPIIVLDSLPGSPVSPPTGTPVTPPVAPPVTPPVVPPATPPAVPPVTPPADISTIIKIPAGATIIMPTGAVTSENQPLSILLKLDSPVTVKAPSYGTALLLREPPAGTKLVVRQPTLTDRITEILPGEAGLFAIPIGPFPTSITLVKIE